MTGMDNTSWVEDGVTPHPTGGYVRVERLPGEAVRYLNAQRELHRLDGPAIEWSTGDREWWVVGKLHRLDGPAIEYADGARRWYVDDKGHRLDGPAVEWADGTREWYVDGMKHRFDGPAVEWGNGTCKWWLRGVEVTEAEHAEIVARLRETGEAPDK